MIDKLKTVGTTELILGEVVVLILFWLSSDFIAFLFSVIISVISFAVLIVSLIAESIEKSKVSKKYFLALFFLGLMPIIVGSLYYVMNQGFSFD